MMDTKPFVYDASKTSGGSDTLTTTRCDGENVAVHRMLLALLLCASAGAGSAQEPLRELSGSELDRLWLRQERERQEQEIQRELDKERDGGQRQVDSPLTFPEPTMGAGDEFQINEISLKGDGRPSARRLAILSRYEGTRMGAADMVALVRDLTNDYAADGYVTTTVTVQPQNIRSGELVLLVNWGKVKDWRINGPLAAWRERAIRAALPQVQGERLNIRVVDQAVEALNNGVLSARIDVVAAEEAGQSYLDVTLQDRSDAGVSLSVDNSGLGGDNQGRYRANGAWTFSGIGADVWNLGGSSRYFGDGSSDSEESLSLGATLPVGSWQWEARQGASRYTKRIRTIFGGYDSRGDSMDQSLRASRTLRRSSQGKTAASMRVSHRDSNNYIEGMRLDVNSKRYTDLAFGVMHIGRMKGGALYADFNWTRGLRWLGANDLDKPEVGRTMALYQKLSGNISWSRAWQPLGHRLFYTIRGGLQYGPYAMLTTNKLSIGDEYTVRGFKGESIYGDSGAYVSNTVQTPLFAGYSLSAGLDAGVVRDAYARASSQYISGFSLGLRKAWRYGGFSMTAATPLRSVDYMSGRPVIYANATVNF